MTEGRLADWIYAGVAVPDVGTLDRSLFAQQWFFASPIECRDGMLRWPTPGSPLAQVEMAHVPADYFDQVVAITQETPDDDILALAKTVGPLGIEAEEMFIGAVDGGHGPHEEPVTVWRATADSVRATLNVISAIHLGECPSPAAWSAAWPALGDVVARDEPTLESHRIYLGGLLTHWLHKAQVGLAFRWKEDNPRIEPRPLSAFGALAAQLVLAAARVEELAHCSACKRPYLPTRRPARGARHYCPDCGIRAAQRDASADYRKRKKKERGS